MSQYRRDRVVIGGQRATAGGRAASLKARGYNEIAARLRAERVLELRIQGHTWRAIAEIVGISDTQAQRDYDSIVCISPQQRQQAALEDAMFRRWFLGRKEKPRLTYPRLAEITGIPERTIGDLVRAGHKRALRCAEASTREEAARLREEVDAARSVV